MAGGAYDAAGEEVDCAADACWCGRSVGGEAGSGGRCDGDVLLVGCGGGSVVELVEVQMEGKRRMSAAEFLRGYQVRSGERLGL